MKYFCFAVYGMVCSSEKRKRDDGSCDGAADPSHGSSVTTSGHHTRNWCTVAIQLSPKTVILFFLSQSSSSLGKN
jgi:hypothetical protein